MSNLIYDLAIVPLQASLKNLDALIVKAEEHLEGHPDIEAHTLFNARLYPDMRPLVFQVRVATDTAKGAAARLSGQQVPSWPDDEESFEDLHQRVAKAMEYLAEFQPSDFEGSETRDIELPLRSGTLHFKGKDYIARFVLPNFFFHVTTAYNILRHNGVVIGKRDYLGNR